MSSRVRVSRKDNVRNSRIAIRQKAVYAWYAHLSKDDDIDIYSPEWQQLLTKWYDWVVKTYGAQDLQSKTLDPSQDVADDLDLRRFFFQEPIAAYSLWHVLQACYELDVAVCGTEGNGVIKKWQWLPPFVYLSFKEVPESWASALQTLSRQIENEELDDEAFITRMYGIYRGIEKLKDSFRTLQVNCAAELEGTRLAASILERVGEGYRSRCNMVVNCLNAGNERQNGNGTTENSDVDHGVLATPPKPLRNDRAIGRKQRTRNTSSQSSSKAI